MPLSQEGYLYSIEDSIISPHLGSISINSNNINIIIMIKVNLTCWHGWQLVGRITINKECQRGRLNCLKHSMIYNKIIIKVILIWTIHKIMWILLIIFSWRVHTIYKHSRIILNIIIINKILTIIKISLIKNLSIIKVNLIINNNKTLIIGTMKNNLLNI